jgi:hypothetical protein
MLEDFRDVMIIIMAFMAIGASLLLATLAILLFRKVSQTVDTAQGLVSDVRDVTSLVSDSIVRPAIKGLSLVAGLKKAVNTLSKREDTKEKKDGKRKGKTK